MLTDKYHCILRLSRPRDPQACLQRLSQSLKNRVAELEALPTLKRNRHLFGNCDRQFLGGLMLALTEVHLMPAEQVLKCGDMARELSFAKKGTLVVTDRKDVLVELISGEGTSECVVGAVSFFMGMRLLRGP
jgi:hypothetical protein